MLRKWTLIIGKPIRCGIIFHAALWVLCRYRHKTHNAGHSSRLNRAEITEMASFGSQTYSKEELTAELGAAYLCGVTGISAITIDNSTAYISGWLNKLRGDKRFFFEAAQKAQKAANYIQNLNPQYEA
jgi:antirestriction protein ArdC